MAFKKITQADTTGKWIEGIPDTPGLTTAEMQAKFDEISRDVVIPAHNELVDQLEAADGSAGGNIKVVNPKTSSGGTLNETLSAIEQENAQNTQKAHTHDNKSVLDAITSAVKTGYDRLVTLFTGITGIDNSTLTDSNASLPTSKTTKDYVDDKVTDVEGDITALGGTVSDIGEDLATTKTEVSANTAARHTHENKSVLDAITSAVKTGYDRVVTLFANITGIDSSVTSATNKIPTSKAVKDKTDTMQTEITANTNARHTHSNKSVLDAITSTVKTGYDRLVTLFANITGIDTSIGANPTDTKLPTTKAVNTSIANLANNIPSLVSRMIGQIFGDVTGFETTLTNTNDKAPTSHAVKVYVDEHGGGGGGGGDMYKSTYDTNDDGVVDDSERFGGKLPSYYGWEKFNSFNIEANSPAQGTRLTFVQLAGVTRKIAGSLVPSIASVVEYGLNVANIYNTMTLTQYGIEAKFSFPSQNIIINGTATADVEIWLGALAFTEHSAIFPGKEYRLSGCYYPSDNIKLMIAHSAQSSAYGDGTKVYQYNGEPVVFTPGNGYVNLGVYVKSGTTVNNVKISPIVARTNTPNDMYAPCHALTNGSSSGENAIKLNGIPVPSGRLGYIVIDGEQYISDIFIPKYKAIIRYCAEIADYDGTQDLTDTIWICDTSEYTPGQNPPTGSHVVYAIPQSVEPLSETQYFGEIAYVDVQATIKTDANTAPWITAKMPGGEIGNAIDGIQQTLDRTQISNPPLEEGEYVLSCSVEEDHGYISPEYEWSKKSGASENVVSVQADGVKTYAQLFTELFALIPVRTQWTSHNPRLVIRDLTRRTSRTGEESVLSNNVSYPVLNVVKSTNQSTMAVTNVSIVCEGFGHHGTTQGILLYSLASIMPANGARLMDFSGQTTDFSSEVAFADEIQNGKTIMFEFVY